MLLHPRRRQIHVDSDVRDAHCPVTRLLARSSTLAATPCSASQRRARSVAVEATLAGTAADQRRGPAAADHRIAAARRNNQATSRPKTHRRIHNNASPASPRVALASSIASSSVMLPVCSRGARAPWRRRRTGPVSEEARNWRLRSAQPCWRAAVGPPHLQLQRHQAL